MHELKVLLWNVLWRRAGTPAGDAIRRIIEAHDPDLVCLTEASRDLLPQSNLITSEEHVGSARYQAARHKVMLWSRQPWRDVDPIGHPELPPARFIRGTTELAGQPLSVIGVCIPWSMAHVALGRRDRRPWEEHQLYLDALAKMIGPSGPSPGTLMLGDFNQAIPRRRAPKLSFESLSDLLSRGFSVPTAGALPPFPAPPIDHLAHSSDIVALEVSPLPNATPDGARISDHVGMLIRIALA